MIACKYRIDNWSTGVVEDGFLCRALWERTVEVEVVGTICGVDALSIGGRAEGSCVVMRCRWSEACRHTCSTFRVS